MNPDTQNISQTLSSSPAGASASLPLCSNVSPKLRRCRQPVTHLGAQFCRTHSRIRRPRQLEANPLTDLPADLSSLNSYSEVTLFLARVLTLLSENRISPRRAAVLTYIANSILNSLRAAERQTLLLAKNPPDEPLNIDWSAMTRVEPDPPASPEPSSELPGSAAAISDQTLAPALATSESDPCPSLASPLLSSTQTPVPAPYQPSLNPPPELFHSPQPPRPVALGASRHRRLHWESHRHG